MGWFGEDLKAHFHQHAQAAQTAHHQFGQIKARGIFDDLAAAAHQPPLAIDKTDPNQKIAHAAKAIAPRAAYPSRNGAAQRRALLDEGRIKREILVVGCQRGYDFAEWRAGQRRKSILSGFILQQAR